VATASPTYCRRSFAESFPTLYARQFGRFRMTRITKVSEAFIRCGDYRYGVARLQCTNPECHGELFRPFTCQGYYLCPSCSQKRTLLFAEFLSHRLLLRLPHRVLTFTVPKMLRPYFRYHLELFAEVSRLIYRLVRQFHAGAARRPIHIPFGNLQKMAQAFRQRVLALFLDLRLIERDRTEGLLCWRRSGFSVDGSVGLYATDPAAMERLAQYMARPSISLSKVTLEEQGANVLFHTKYNPTSTRASSFSLSRTSSPSLHNTFPQKACTTSQLRYSASARYGLYSSRTRSTPWAGHRTAWKRCPHLLRLSPLSRAPPESKDQPTRAESIEYARASSTWARLIAKIYGANPLTCPRCGNSMRVLAIITDPSQVEEDPPPSHQDRPCPAGAHMRATALRSTPNSRVGFSRSSRIAEVCSRRSPPGSGSTPSLP
jgi:hypothetical protein